MLAGRFFLLRGQVEGAGAASAGFQSASFCTLIASAFCPPSYRSPRSSPALFCLPRFSSKHPRPKLRQNRYGCGVTCFSAEVSGFKTGFREADTMSYTLWLWSNRKQLERSQRSRGAASSPCFRRYQLDLSRCYLRPRGDTRVRVDKSFFILSI